MKTGTDGHGAASLRDYLHIVRRQKWIILNAVVLVPLIAVLYASQQSAVYRASSQVLLSGQALQNALTGIQSPTSVAASDTLVQTQAELARVPDIAIAAIKALDLPMTPQHFLGVCSVSANANTNILGFACQSNSKTRAMLLVNAFSKQYVIYRRKLDTNALESARQAIAGKIATMNAHGATGALYNNLVAREEQLQTMEELQTSNATVVKVATDVTQVAPRSTRDGFLGLVLGILLGVGLAFLREALDTRVRTAQEIADRLGLPLLGRVPEPPKKLRLDDKLVMLETPSSLHAEAFRVLRTNIEFSVLDSAVRSVMITSAVEQEGKSTTIANLAVAIARGGQSVILVDLDLRRPYLHKFFELGERPGITQVVLGRATLDEALAEIEIAPMKPRGKSSTMPFDLSASNGHNHDAGAIGNGANGNGGGGKLYVLGAGPIPPDPGEFVASHALTSVLLQVKERAEVVLVDSPPLLRVGDSMVLSAKVDGIILATRMEKVRRPMLAELQRMIETSPARLLGFAVTGAEAEEGYGSGYGYGYGSGYGYGYGSRYYLPRGDEPELTEPEPVRAD